MRRGPGVIREEAKWSVVFLPDGNHILLPPPSLSYFFDSLALSLCVDDLCVSLLSQMAFKS